MDRIQAGGLAIDATLADFVMNEAAPGTGIAGMQFWERFGALVREMAPRNAALLARRDTLQAQIDDFFQARTGDFPSAAEQESFLINIGYLVPTPEPFTIDTANVDPEIAKIAAPQLVVPVTNARYALNAVNARWRSLYDALFTTDALSATDMPGGWVAAQDGDRRAAIVARGRALLDLAAPLDMGSHADATGYEIEYGGLLVRMGSRVARLAQAQHFAGYRGTPGAPDCVLLRHHGLHIELRIDRESAIGQGDAAGIADIVIESAVTAIIDFEDSVAIVDADDKVAAYRTLLGLARGTLDVGVSRLGAVVRRELAPDRLYTAPDGSALRLNGRALMLMRTVGHHMMTDAVLDSTGAAIPETMLDAAIGALIATHDLRGTPKFRNGRSGSAYFVKPKLHGPEEVGFADALFDAIEDMLALPRHILKIGIMDEERRTSLNLAACIQAARHRLVFINTGFLDRTGDEIHTLLHAGPPVRKAELHQAAWLAAYEAGNVAAGLACGLGGRAQIGKGMWAEPDGMAAMLRAKGAQPRAGASTAWVPSPVAATLHALHYHEVDVATRQAGLPRGMAPPLEGLLTAAILSPGSLGGDQIAAELDLNLHCILGYVTRWVDQGIGCSKLANLAGTKLMEDRATLRIASQHVAAWLQHGIVSRADVAGSLRRMAELVDTQSAGDPRHRALCPGLDGPAFRAAEALVFDGAARPSGYTESVLHAARRESKAADPAGLAAVG